MPILSPNQQCETMKEKYHITRACSSKGRMEVFQLYL